MYLITVEQFIQVVRQENAKGPEDDSIQIDFEKTIKEGQSLINGNWYRKIIYLGDKEGNPIFTFTGGWEDSDITVNAPGEKYLKTIIKGIKETFGLDGDCIMRYLVGVDGIRGLINEKTLINWIQDVD